MFMCIKNLIIQFLEDHPSAFGTSYVHNSRSDRLDGMEIVGGNPIFFLGEKVSDLDINLLCLSVGTGHYSGGLRNCGPSRGGLGCESRGATTTLLFDPSVRAKKDGGH